MKVDRKYLIKMITEVLIENKALGEAVRKPSPWTMGHIQGNRDARRLALKGEKQSAKGLRAYIQKATENHPDEKWREGYKFAFQLMFSAQLTDPIPDGQLPFANARKRPYGPFRPNRGRNPLKETESNEEFQKLMDLATDSNEGSGIQALEMYEFFDLTEQQIKALYNVVLYTTLKNNIEDVPQVLEMRPPEYTEQEMAVHRDMATKAIIKQSEKPERLLKTIGYDFHKQFTEVFGITPPRDQEFTFEPEGVPWNTNGEDIFLVVLGNVSPAVIVFSLWFEGSNENNPSDPYIHIKNADGEESWFEWNPITDAIVYDSSEKTIDVTKEQISQIIKRETGVSFSNDPVNEKIDRNYLFRMINEVLREEEDDDADFTKKIQDFLDSKDLESLKSALNLLDIYAMSGLIEDEKVNDLKRRMYKVIQDEKMVVSDPKAVYDFINSEEFSSSFDKFAMNDFRRETFSDLFIYSERDIDTIIKLILGDGFEGRIDHYEGNPFNDHYVIEDLKGQEEANEILTRFKQFQGNGSPFAALVTADGDAFVLIGSFATSIANFGRDSNEVFGYRPKTNPEIDGERLFVEEGEGNPYLAKNSPLFDGKDVDYHIKIVKKMFDDWFMVIIFDEGYGGYLRIDYDSQNKSYKTSGKKDKITTLSTKDEMLSKIKEFTGIDLNDVGPSHYERDQMSESVLETEENFGRESRGDEVLQEGWEDQWPPELGGISTAIQNAVPEVFQEAISKVFLRTANISRLMPIRFVRAAANYSADLSESGMTLHRNKISTYKRNIDDIKAAPTIDFPQEEKDEQIKELQDQIEIEQESLNLYSEINSFAREAFYFGKGRRKEVLFQSREIGKANPNTNMPLMRYISKTMKSLKKQLNKWRKKNTDGFGRVNLTIGGIINRLEIEFRDIALEVFDKFKEEQMYLFRYVNSVRGTGKDAAQKLNDWLDKNKDLPLDEYEEGLKLFSVEQNKDYYKDCDDVPDGNPCVFLRLDDGMFWHSTETNYCEITQSEMKHCGGSNNEDSILYNLMSSSEGGSVRYHVTIEYNKNQNKVIQVLGKANTLPKEKYWPSITKFFEAKGDPLLDKDAFQHMYDDEEDAETVDKRVEAFIQGIGVRNTPLPAVQTWEAMKEQLRDGYYSEKTETFAPINDQTNVFRVSLSYSGMNGPVERPGSKAMITLNLQVIQKTKETEKAEEWRKENPNIFREAREFGESQEFKQLLYKALPERITRPNRLDIKYSKISNPRLRLGGLGNYKMRMRVSFKIDVRSWNESKGELLAMRFEELLKDTVRDLPGQAMLVFLAVEGKKKTNEGKEKMKLDRNYLTSMILEVLGEESSSGKFSTVENANQILNLYIDAGMLPAPLKMEINEQWGSIYIKFNSNEELQQLIDLLDEDGVTQQLGTTAQRPAYFVHKTLVNKRKRFYRSDEEPPKPPPATGLTLKL